MDRKKEESEELIKSESSIQPTTPARTTDNTAILTTPADDDTSTESCETFESWTLVNDKEKSKLRTNLVDDSENRVEVLRKNDADDEEEKEMEERNKTEQEPQSQVSPNDATYDDMSDGISIISESESVGRISPHPDIRDHLHDLNIKFSLSDHMDDTILNKMREDMENETVPLLMQQSSEPTNEQHIRQRHRPSIAADASENQALQKASQTVAANTGLVPLVKRGLHGMFYVGVGLALLGLIGKIVNPNWQPLSNVVNSSPSADELEQKVTDMELQNNLMRAEIDLLNKQVKYLSSLNDPQQRKPGKYQDYKESKTFKAWSGNGDSLRPVDITKQDLKKPYKCPDGSFVEIANMCMEQQSDKEPSIVDQFGQVVENLKEQSEAFKAFEQVAEELQGFQDNPFEQLQDVFKEQVNTESKTKEFVKNKPIYNDQKYQPKSGESNLFASHKHHITIDKNGNEYKKYNVKNENNTPSKEYNKYSIQENSGDNSQEKKERKKYNFYRTRHIDSEENSEENQSKERYNKQKRKHDDGGEWQEKYMKHREQQRKKNGNNYDSGEWQEKYMKHREQQRKHNDQKDQNNKNWYIKRGDSRENKRSGEKQFR